MDSGRAVLTRVLPAIAALALWMPSPAAGQAPGEVDVPSVDWYYASVFGTGVYRAGERSVTVLRAPVAWRLPVGERRDWSARLLLPVSIGWVDFGLESVIEEPLDSVSMLIFTPGVEFELPLARDWTLKPYLNAGGGVEFQGDDSAWIYAAGLRARRALPCDAGECTFGASLTWAAYHSSHYGRDDLTQLGLGLDLVGRRGPRWGGQQFRLGAFVVYRNYLEALDFVFDPLGIEPLDSEWELGVTLNPERELKILGLGIQRLGLGYRRGKGLRGLHLVTQFPF